MANEIKYSNSLLYEASSYLDAKINPVDTYKKLTEYNVKYRFPGLMLVVKHDETNDNKSSIYVLAEDNITWVRVETKFEIEGNDIEYTNDTKFKGFSQVTLDFYNTLTSEEKSNTIWFVRDDKSDPISFSIYFGKRKYGEINDSSDVSILNEIINNILSSLGYAFNNDGTYEGFPLSNLLKNSISISDAISKLDDAIVENIEKIKIAWHFKGTVSKESNLPKNNQTEGDVYFVANQDFFVWYNGAWRQVNKNTTKYIGGDGIIITDDLVINGNTEIKTTEDLFVNGGPIDAINIWENNIIPSGTTVQEILSKLLCETKYPSVPNLPKTHLESNNMSYMTFVNTPVNISGIETVNGIKGSFDSLNLINNQVEARHEFYSTILTYYLNGLIKEGEGSIITYTQNDGTITNTLGEITNNEVGKYTIDVTAYQIYSKPINKPINNFGEEVTITGITDENNSAIWNDGDTSEDLQTYSFDVYVCYPCYSNISEDGLTLTDNIIKLPIETGSTITFNVPSEVINNKHLSVYVPSEKFNKLQVVMFDGIVNYNGKINIDTVDIDGVDYVKVSTDGPLQGDTTYQISLNSNLYEK